MQIVILICGLFCGYIIYKQGVRDGIEMSKGKEVKILPNPVKAIQQHKENKETKENEQQFISSIDNMFSYDGTQQKVGESNG